MVEEGTSRIEMNKRYLVNIIDPRAIGIQKHRANCGKKGDGKIEKQDFSTLGFGILILFEISYFTESWESFSATAVVSIVGPWNPGRATRIRWVGVQNK